LESKVSSGSGERRFWGLGLALLLCSCGVREDRASQRRLMKSLSARDYGSAQELVERDSFYPEERSELLRELERGTVFYLAGRYYQALESFTRARQKSDELFTRSIGGKMKSLASENLDKYYGERYERSLIRFYESLVNYRLYRVGVYEAHERRENGKILPVPEKKLSDVERRRHLMGARGLLVEWDSLLNSYRTELAGQSTYRRDLLAKLWAGFIHEQVGTSEDRQIALQLHRDAREVLLRHYNAYPTFNRKHKSFDDNFSKLAQMPLAVVKSKFIDSTQAAREVEAFVDSKVEKLSENRKDNLFILLKKGFVSPRKAKKISLKMPGDLLLRVGSGDREFVTFAEAKLSGTKGGGASLVEFELPSIEPPARGYLSYRVTISDSSGREVEKFPLVLAEPVTDIAVKALGDRVMSIYLQTFLTVATKYATAMYTAYRIYKNNNGSDFGFLLATTSYLAAVKAIAETTMADLRCWTSLADGIYLGSTRLKPGKYSLAIVSQAPDGARSVVHSQGLNLGHSNSEFIDLNL
jgi:hypothetical protein